MAGGSKRILGILAAAVVALVALALPALAPASNWQPAQLPGVAGKSFVLAVSCPSRSLCVATGTNNMVASTTNPSGGSAAWDPVFVGDGPWPNSEDWPNQEISGLQIEAISCPSTELCVAVMNKGFVYTSTNPAGPASAWKAVEVDEPGNRNTHLTDVSCATPRLCVAVAERRVGGGSGGGDEIGANQGKVLVSTDPTGNIDAWRPVPLAEPFDFRAISCPRADLCVATGDDGRLVVSDAPANAGSWRILGAPAGPGTMQAISCVGTQLCLAGNEGGNLITTSNPVGGLGGWSAVNGGGSVQITGASCPSSSECLVVDNNGSVITSTDPTGPASSWHYLNLLRYELPQGGSFQEGNGLFGASCVSRAFCAVTGARGQILTSTDPFAVSPAATEKRKGKRRGAKRPRAKIAKVALLFRNAIHHGRGKVMVRFFARGGPRGFVCKLDRSRYRPCRSPRRFRVTLGNHRFSVRAVGRTGKRGPAARALIHIVRSCPGPALMRPGRHGCGSWADY